MTGERLFRDGLKLTRLVTRIRFDLEPDPTDLASVGRFDLNPIGSGLVVRFRRIAAETFFSSTGDGNRNEIEFLPAVIRL